MALRKIPKARKTYEGSVVVIDVRPARRIAKIRESTALAWGLEGCRSVDPLYDDCDPDVLYLQFREDLEGTYRLSCVGSSYCFACGGIIRHFAKRKSSNPFPSTGSVAFNGVREKGRFVRMNLREKVSPK